MKDSSKPGTGKAANSEKIHQRSRDLDNYAQIAYQNMPTQEEMLTGGQPVPPSKPQKNADPKLTEEIDDSLYEAAQQGNIGGG
jgi:hypothetical protein